MIMKGIDGNDDDDNDEFYLKIVKLRGKKYPTLFYKYNTQNSSCRHKSNT